MEKWKDKRRWRRWNIFLDKVGEFTVEFLLVAIELVAIQEKTNYPTGTLTKSLYEGFGVKDRFQIIQKSIWRG